MRMVSPTWDEAIDLCDDVGGAMREVIPELEVTAEATVATITGGKQLSDAMDPDTVQTMRWVGLSNRLVQAETEDVLAVLWHIGGIRKIR